MMLKYPELALAVMCLGLCACEQNARTGKAGAEARISRAVENGMTLAQAQSAEAANQESFMWAGADWTAADETSGCEVERQIVYGSIGKKDRAYRDAFVGGYDPAGIREAKATLVVDGKKIPVAWSWAWGTSDRYSNDRINSKNHWFQIVHLPGADNWIISQVSGLPNQTSGPSGYYDWGIEPHLETRDCASENNTQGEGLVSFYFGSVRMRHR